MKTPPNPLNPSGQHQTKKEAERVQHARETLSWLDPLAEFPQFATFMQKVVAPMLRDARVAALNVELTPEQRNNAAFRHDSIEQIFDWVALQRKRCHDVIDADEARKRPTETPKRAVL